MANISGTNADDGLLGTNLADRIDGRGGNDIIRGRDGADELLGGAGDDDLDGGKGDDVLIGGAGADFHDGGINELGSPGGVDTASYRDAPSGVVADTRFSAGNTGDAAGDTYFSIENLEGSNFDDVLRGGDSPNRLDGGNGNDVLVGRGGADQLFGGSGFDTADFSGNVSGVALDLTAGVGTLGEAAGDTYDSIENVAGSNFGDGIRGSAVSNQLSGRDGNDVLHGMGGDDTIDGGSGNDRLFGGVGADRLVGGFGTDIVDYTDSTLAVSLDLDTGATGGGAFRDTLDSIEGAVGSVFADILRGHDGQFADDIFFGLDGNDLIFGRGGQDTLHGEGGNDTLFGDAGADELIGGDGDDMLDGGIQQDHMRGGSGNDRYVVDHIDDVVDELFATGRDEIVASISFSLANPVAVRGSLEELTLTGTADLNGTGNDLANRIAGNFGDNILSGGGGNDVLLGGAGSDVLQGGADNDLLDGGAGADRLEGGFGDDIYIVDRQEDLVIETAGDGAADRVMARDSYALAKDADIERLTTTSSTGTTAINLTGNTLAQEIVGNAGSNVLHDGGGAADILRGLGGDDTYRVFNSGDTIVESSTQGEADLVMAAVDYVLTAGAYVERLATNGTSGTTSIDLTGNELAQEVVGNAGVNILDGKAGDDTMKGLLGNDTLTGGAGKDNFVFNSALNAATNVDTIKDFSAADDTIQLENAIFTALTTTGALAAGAFRANTTGLAGDASDRIIYESDTGKLFYDADGTGAGAGIHFATLTGLPAITAADFAVI